MASLFEECGYDEDFVDPPPEYLKCIICHFVLKSPVQLMQCGHRYCESCFERIKSYSKHLNSVLSCPVDREEIEINQVFKDTATKRFIADLLVKCPHNIHGCLWTGELRNLEDHKMQCNHIQKDATTIGVAGSSGNEVDGSLLKDMLVRLNRCEEVIVEKEKDMAHIKFNLREMEEKVNKRDKEIDELKLKNEDMAMEMNLLKEMGKTLQENVDKVLLKCENNYSSNKNEIDQLKLVQRQTSRLRNEEVDKIRVEIEDVNNKLIESKKQDSQSCKTEERFKTIEKGLKDTHEQLCKVDRDITTKQNNVDQTLSNMKGQVNGLHSKTDRSLNDLKAKVKGFIQEPFNEVSNKVDELQAYVNHTNGLLSFKDISCKNTSFVWTIPNFRHILEARNDIESSKFYCRPKGHLCQLYGHFVGPGEESMMPAFRLVKGRNSADVADFEMNISCDLLYNDGTKVSDTISSVHINQYRECFTLHGNSQVTRGLGFEIYLNQDDLEKYVIDDTCTLVCTITPSN